MTNRACILNPHDDDGIIAIGGILWQLKDKGWELGYIQMTDGRHGGNLPPEEIKEMRAKEAEEERKFLGVRDYYNFDIEDGKLENYKDDEGIIEKVAKMIKDSNVVFLPNKADAHPDHRATYEIGHKALELVGNDRTPLEVHYVVWLFPFRSYEPGTFERILKVNIDNQIGRKLEGIRKHRSQVEWGRYDEIAEHLNRVFSLLYSTYRSRKNKYSEIVGIPRVNENYHLFVNSLESVEDVTEIFHGRKSANIKG